MWKKANSDAVLPKGLLHMLRHNHVLTPAIYRQMLGRRICCSNGFMSDLCDGYDLQSTHIPDNVHPATRVARFTERVSC